MIGKVVTTAEEFDSYPRGTEFVEIATGGTWSLLPERYSDQLQGVHRQAIIDHLPMRVSFEPPVGDLQTFYVTLGVQYRGPGSLQGEIHPVLPITQSNPHGFLTIQAPDYETARMLTMSVLGASWAFIYTEEEWKSKKIAERYQTAGSTGTIQISFPMKAMAR